MKIGHSLGDAPDGTSRRSARCMHPRGIPGGLFRAFLLVTFRRFLVALKGQERCPTMPRYRTFGHLFNEVLRLGRGPGPVGRAWSALLSANGELADKGRPIDHDDA